MNRRLFFIGLSGPLAAAAAGLGATDRGFIDGLKLDPNTKAATLMMVIDRPLEDGLTKPRVRSKLLAYHHWVYVDQQLIKLHPEVDLGAGVGLLLLHPEPKSSLGRSVLEQLAGYAKELNFTPTLKALPHKP